MAHIIRKNAGKKTRTIFELFTNKIFEFTFVSIFADMTIYPVLQKISHTYTDNDQIVDMLLNIEQILQRQMEKVLTKIF